MPFNSETYRMNQYRKQAWSELAQARDIRERAKAGDAYDWEIPRIAMFVKLARISMHMHLSMRRIKAIG